MKNISCLLLAAALGLSSPAIAAPQEQTGAATLALDDAVKMSMAAIKAAKEKQRAMAIVIVNREGRIISAMRMDGASFMNLDVAQSKATTSAATGAPTAAIEQVVEGGKYSLLTAPGMSAIGGGLPVMRAGQVIAGVAASGGTAEEDQSVAQAALDVLSR